MMRGHLVSVLALALSAPAVLQAQAGSAQLAGAVRDGGGAAVPGAVVTITHRATNQSRTAITDTAGLFGAAGLAPGEYAIRVELEGFRPLVRGGLTLETGESVRIDLELGIGPVTETVTVTADAPTLQTHRASLGHLVDQERIVGLPLNGRTFVSFTALSPGVALPPGSLLPRINGGRPRTNEYLYDGVSVLQPEPGQVAFFPVVDAIQEFRIERNAPPAEFGRFNGGVINLTTKSGSNAFRGTAFAFLRHEALNARHVFASDSPAMPRFRRHQSGGVLGGPFRRDRTFFFIDYQGQRQTIARTVISTVPTALQRRGIFTEPIDGRVPTIHDPATGPARSPFAHNSIPDDRIDPLARTLLGRYPLPTSDGTVNNYRRVGHEVHDQDQFDVRLDQRITSRDQAFVRLSSARESFRPVAPLPDGSGAAAGTLGPQATRVWAIASNHRRILADRLINELRAGDTRRSVRRTAAQLAAPASAALGLPGLPATAHFPDTLPTFLISGYQQLGSPPNTATRFATGVTHVVDTLTWARGRHTVKTGLDLRWQRLNVLQPPAPTGSFGFTSLFTDLPGVPGTGWPLASFLLGQVQLFSIDLQHAEIRHRAHVQEYFVQDDWTINDRVAVNAGVRYTLNFPSTEQRNQAAVFNLDTQRLELLGRDGHPRSARRLHTLDLGPRLGVVTRLTDRMVVRAGYGLIRIEQAGITTPFTTPVFPFLQTVTQRTLDNLTPAFVLADGPSVAPMPLTPDAGLGQGVFAVDRHLGSGYVQQWNVAFQRSLSPTTSVEVAYVGSSIRRVGVPDANLNQLTVDQLALGPALLQRVPNPFFGTVPASSSLGEPTIPLAQLLKPYPRFTTVSLYRHNVGTTSYHGVEARVERRLSGGLSFEVSYTRSRLMDDASSVFDASILTGPVANYPVADSFNRQLERDYSTGDIPHVLVSSFIWHLPLGEGRRARPRGVIGAMLSDWTVTGVVTLQSGVPVPVTQATNFNAFAGFGTQRPHLVGDPRLPAAGRSAARWFDTAAFAEAPPFTIGTSSRNPVRGPAYRNFDLALLRRVPLRAGTVLELRGEVFNLANTPPLGAPNGVLGTPGFGSITSAGDPRVVQLAIKLAF